MLICRTAETRYIAFHRQALQTFLQEQQFEDAFLRDLGIFLLPEESDEEEDSLCDDSPVSNNLFLYTNQQSEEELNRRLLELIRECALEEDAAPWEAASFLGAQNVKDWEQDIKAFGALAEHHQFLSISQEIQSHIEHDLDLSDEEIQECLGRENQEPHYKQSDVLFQVGMLVLVLVCLIRVIGWLSHQKEQPCK